MVEMNTEPTTKFSLKFLHNYLHSSPVLVRRSISHKFRLKQSQYGGAVSKMFIIARIFTEAVKGF